MCCISIFLVPIWSFQISLSVEFNFSSLMCVCVGVSHFFEKFFSIDFIWIMDLCGKLLIIKWVYVIAIYARNCAWEVLLWNCDMSCYAHNCVRSCHVNKLNYERFINYNLISAYKMYVVLLCAAFKTNETINISNKSRSIVIR